MSAKIISHPDWAPVTIELTFQTKDQLIAFVALYDGPDASSCFIEEILPRSRAYDAIDQTIDVDTLVQLANLTK